MAAELEDDEPLAKKRRKPDLESNVLLLKQQPFFADIVSCLKQLSEENNLVVLEIDISNALVGYGVPFSKAFCDTKILPHEFYSLDSFFVPGLSHLEKILKDPKYVPQDECSVLALRKLMIFLLDEASREFIWHLGQKKTLLNNETRLSVALAEHILKKLAPRTNYTLDNHYHDRRSDEDFECRCGCNTTVDREMFGNTSIGHPKVWHGNIDILVGKVEVPVVVKVPKKSNSPGGRTPVEVKHHFGTGYIEDFPIKQQMLAQTIVFSFLQKKRHPDSKHFLIPCVGMTGQQVIFYLYDSQNDVLLQSKPMSLRVLNKLNYTAIIALWLVLNYQHLGSGLSEYTAKNITKAKFLKNAPDEIEEIYNHLLSIGDVAGRDMPDTIVDCASFYDKRMVKPPDVPKFNWDGIL